MDDSEKLVSGDDASWIITNAFIIFTMQTGKLFIPQCPFEVLVQCHQVLDAMHQVLVFWNRHACPQKTT